MVAGYLSGVGTLIIIAQFPKLLGLPKGYTFLTAWASPNAWAWQSIAIGITTIAAMLLAPRFVKKVPAAIIALAAGIGAYFAIAAVNPAMRVLEGNSFVIGAISSNANFIGAIAAQWKGMLGISGPALGLIVVPALTLAALLSVDTLKTCVVLNALTRTRSNSNRELMGQGIGNIAAGLVGGVPGAGTMGPTIVNVSSGGQTRFSGLVEGVSALLVLLLLGTYIAWIPIASLAGILIVVGVRMIDKKSFKLLKQKSTLVDFFVILAVVVAAVSLSLIWAAAAGIAMAILLFLRDQISRPVVRRTFTGDQVFSKKKRLPAEMEALVRSGKQTAVFELQGQLFFGTTDQLLLEIERSLAGVHFVILCMRRVQAVDYTAAYVLAQIEARVAQTGGTLAFAAVPEDVSSRVSIRQYLEDLGFETGKKEVRFFDSLDAALAWAEDEILKTMLSSDGRNDEPLALAHIPFFERVDTRGLAVLQGLVKERTYAAGEAIFRKNDTGTEIFFIRKGAVRILLPVSQGYSHHLATFGRGDFFGDMSFLDKETRSANAVADEPAMLYVLTRDDFDRMSKEHMEVASVVFEGLARMLALRLRHTNIELEALEKA